MTLSSQTSESVAAVNGQIWSYVVPVYLGWRIWWANRMPIMDCDEVFNYWEPLHFLLYRTGFQTWEYSNEFALRTYAYLMPLVSLAKIWKAVIPFLPSWWWPLLTSQPILQQGYVLGSTAGGLPDKMALFIVLRASLAGIMGMAEVSFCRELEVLCSGQGTKNSNAVSTIGLVTAGLLLFSTGMSHASGALLPSSTLTLLWLSAAVAFLKQQHFGFATRAILATLAIGWPFGVLMFVPMGLVALFRERSRLVSFVLKIAATTLLVQGVVMLIDYEQYGRWVSPVWNILVYNTQAGGDELYGIEPWTYYVKNLLLNFNYVTVGVLALLIVPLWTGIQGSSRVSLLALLLPMYIWLGVVFPRPHKEERFLFPIYPCLCLGAAFVSVSMVDFVARSVFSANWTRRTCLCIQAILWAPAMVLSFGRTYALSLYYTAPLQVYAQLPQHVDQADAVVCTCGEWYRFPSSFYLPSNVESFGFVPSSFDGQLPQAFLPFGSALPTEADETPLHFNDQNQAEAGSYTPLDQCDYLVDLWTSTDCRENDSIWKPLALGAFLDAERTTTLHRSVYLPWYHEQEEARGNVQYVDYILYQRSEESS